MLIPMGIRWARGFALNSTHYDSTERQVRYSADIARALAARGMPGQVRRHQHLRPTAGPSRATSTAARTSTTPRACRSQQDKRCVTLGIPPTVDVGDPKWGLSANDRRLAEKYVDAYLWFGRPWLYNQAAPFLLDRALDLARTTPY